MIAGFLPSLAAFVPGIVSLVGEVAWKAALLYAAVALVHLFAGRKQVLLRSAVWHLCLLGFMVLPVAVAVLPRTRVALAIADERPAPNFNLVSPATVARAEATRPLENPAEFDDAAELTHHSTVATGSVLAFKATTFELGGIVRSSLLVTYVAVLAVFLIRLGVSVASVSRLHRASGAVSNPAWLTALDCWRTRFALPASTQLRQAESVNVPIVVGWRRPLIVLPASFAQTTDRQAIDAVLLHELTHVGRGDYAWNLLLRLVEALYWPHPCAWAAGGMVRRMREEVCDAVCVHWIGDVRAYCAILVEVAADIARHSQMALGMAMTRSSKLSRRLARVEQISGISRGLLGRPTRTAMALVVVATAGMLGSFQIAAQVSRELRRRADDEQSGQSADETQDGAPKDVGSNLRPGRQSKLGDKGQPAGSTKDARQNFWVDRATENQYFVTVDPNNSEPKQVTMVKVKRGKLQKTISVAASLTAFEPVSIRARLAGVVSKVNVAEGDRVKKGDLLLVVDVPDRESDEARSEAALAQAEAHVEQTGAALEAAQASVAAAEATIQEGEADTLRAAAALTLAKKQHDRMQTLLEEKAIDAAIVDEHREKLSAADADKKATAARLQTARANLTRTKAGVRLAEADLRAARLRVAAAEADVKRGQTLEAFREIRAPIDGVILTRQVDADMFLKPDGGRSLLTLAPTTVVTAMVALADKDAPLVKRGALATISVRAIDEPSHFSGKVSRVAYGVDPGTHTVAVQIIVANPDEVLKPGMFAKAKIVVGEIANALSLPASALTTINPASALAAGEEPKTVCFRIVDGRTEMTMVELGFRGDEVEVLEGLKDGDEVVGNAKALPDTAYSQPLEVKGPLKR
jgi:RND family efflux transporter MFP subunit